MADPVVLIINGDEEDVGPFFLRQEGAGKGQGGGEERCGKFHEKEPVAGAKERCSGRRLSSAGASAVFASAGIPAESARLPPFNGAMKIHLLLLPLLFCSLSTLTGAEEKPVDAPAVESKKDEPADPLAGLKAETARLEAERSKITAQLALEQARLDEKLAGQKRAVAEIQAQMEDLKTRMDLAEIKRRSADDPELLELRRKSERLVLEAVIAKNEVELQSFEMRKKENEVRARTSEITLQIELQQKEAEARTHAVGKAPEYLKDPHQGGKLVISDRRIALNGVITAKTADHIADRIAYFNNRDSEAPIFIVIDDCPGGSVMAGYKIIKAMHGSKAPVHTVVKSFAASMAACITTVSKKSFAYPNAILLHHQLSVGVAGNLTQHRENVKQLEEWWRRLADPVAEKMGLTREEFIARMYQEASTGDWSEFADNARKLKWVDEIVEDIEETSLLRHPDSQQTASTTSAPRLPGMPPQTEIIESNDERGKPIALLPRLNPLDAYWLYNPDGFYRLQ